MGLCLLRRAFEDEKKARMGVVECAKHELLQPFNVLYEKEGECWWWEGWERGVDGQTTVGRFRSLATPVLVAAA